MLGAPRASNPLARSAKPGGGSIPLAPSINKSGCIENRQMKEKYVTIGVAGHVDHGKTSLVKCLTGTDTDRLHEEKRRGLSIESGIAPFRSNVSNMQIAFVDVPGHTDFLKNTIRGLSGVDMAILVVAADDGLMPQTLAHLRILNFFDVKNGFIVLSKSDLADDKILYLAELEIREAVEGTFLDEKPVIAFSMTDKKGLLEIEKCIVETAKKITIKDPSLPFRLWIDQVKSFTGLGTVVTGTIQSGTLNQGDKIHLLPVGIETRARLLEMHHDKADKAVAGQRVGINIPKIPVTDVKRGMVLSIPDAIHPTYLLNVEIRLLETAKKPIENRQRVKLYLGTSVTNAMIVLMEQGLEQEHLYPGEKGLVQVRLMKPVPALPGDPLKVRASYEEIKDRLSPRLNDAPFRRMTSELLNEKKIIKSEGGFQVPDYTANLSNDREKLITLLEDYAQTSWLVPFSAHTFWTLNKKPYNLNEVQRVLDYLYLQKRLIRLNNRRFISHDAMAVIKEKVKKLISSKGGLTIDDGKEVLGYGRTVGISVFEYLDSINFTQRKNDMRVLIDPEIAKQDGP